MDFAERVAGLSQRSKAAEKQAETEEATKTAVVLPFLQALGFDVFSLDEVIPEFVADVGIKKGEKVDFAVKVDGEIAILIEAKPIHAKLGDAQYSQLFRYFSVTDARLAILMNGREAWFFSDTDAPNKMDKKPFFKFDLQKYDKSQLNELARFQKESFAIDSIIEAASNLKFMQQAANYLRRQMTDPEDEFVKLVGRSFFSGSITKAVMEQIRPAIAGAMDELIRERIQDRLSITLSSDLPPKEPDHADVPADIVTSDKEREGYMIVRAIAANIAPINRIFMRDSKSYCAILMDDNNRRPICRLYFNSETTMHLGLFDADKVETKIKIGAPTDIYKHCSAIEETVSRYVN